MDPHAIGVFEGRVKWGVDRDHRDLHGFKTPDGHGFGDRVGWLDFLGAVSVDGFDRMLCPFKAGVTDAFHIVDYAVDRIIATELVENVDRGRCSVF